jgi:uncharacterized membrane protein
MCAEEKVCNRRVARMIALGTVLLYTALATQAAAGWNECMSE